MSSQTTDYFHEDNPIYKAFFLDNHPVLLIIDTETAQILDANKSACRFYGYTLNEIRQKHIYEINRLDKKQVLEKMKKAQAGTQSTFLFEHQLANGDIKQVEVHSGLIHYKGRQVLYSTVIDVSEREVAYNLLRENLAMIDAQESEITQHNKRLECLQKVAQYRTESVQDLLDYALEQAIELTQSKIGYIYFYNSEKKEFTLNTWSKEVMNQCQVMNPQTIYRLDDTGCWGEAVRQRKPYFINNYQAGDEYIKGTPHGHVQLKKFLTIPVIFEGEIVAVAGMANKEQDYNHTDIKQLTLMMDSVWRISERLRMLDKIKRAKENLMEANNTKDKFFSIISHDLRTPFSVLMGYAEMLKENWENFSKEKIEILLKNLDTTAKTTYHFLEDLLRWANLQQGKIPFSPQTLHVNESIKQSIGPLNAFSQKKQIEIDVRIDKNLLIFADKQMFALIVRNLISNALKFSLPNNKIILDATPNKDNTVFRVIDTGVGVPPSFQPKLFKIEKNNSAVGTNGERGTGLGLVLCREFVEMHQGKIWYEPNQPKGAVFAFEIPNL